MMMMMGTKTRWWLQPFFEGLTQIFLEICHYDGSNHLFFYTKLECDCEMLTSWGKPWLGKPKLSSNLATGYMYCGRGSFSVRNHPTNVSISWMGILLCLDIPHQDFCMACWTQQFPWWCKLYIANNITVPQKILETSLTVVHKFDESFWKHSKTNIQT